MNLIITSSALILALLAALAFYLSSPNCPWTAFQHSRRLGNSSGMAFAIASLTLWIAALGIGAGLCAMLASGMLGLIVLPYLALATKGKATGEDA